MFHDIVHKCPGNRYLLTVQYSSEIPLASIDVTHNLQLDKIPECDYFGYVL